MFFEDIFVEPHNSFDKTLFFVLLFAVVVGLQDRATVSGCSFHRGLCAVYVPELMACIGQGDPLKLRERLLVRL